MSFKNPAFELPGSTPEAELAGILAAALTTSHGCQQDMYKTLGGKKK